MKFFSFHSSFSFFSSFPFFLFLTAACSPDKNGEPGTHPMDTTVSARRDGSVTVADTLPAGLNIAENNEFRLLEEESLGDYSIDMPVNKIIQKEGEPDEKSSFELWGADGLEHASWKYNGAGMELWVYKDEEEIRVGSLFIYGPSKLSTARGIKLGDSEKEVKKQYGEVLADESTDDEIIAGSIYGGLKFQIYEGKVTSIFLGAMAE